MADPACSASSSPGTSQTRTNPARGNRGTQSNPGTAQAGSDGKEEETLVGWLSGWMCAYALLSGLSVLSHEVMIREAVLERLGSARPEPLEYC
jgi:hypothetical protein